MLEREVYYISVNSGIYLNLSYFRVYGMVWILEALSFIESGNYFRVALALIRHTFYRLKAAQLPAEHSVALLSMLNSCNNQISFNNFRPSH